MKSTFFGVAALLAMTSTHALAEDAQGYWTGKIGNALQVNVQFKQPAGGQWEATLHVPAQGLKAKVDAVTVTPDQISFALPKFRASYAATWSTKDNAWIGTWTQGRAAPLNLTRSSAEALRPKRPQEEAISARAPVYGSSDVSFDNDAASVRLSGTLTVPNGKGPFPAVVLVHGSGSINRDGEIFGHKPLLVLADHLSRQGIAVLRYDKRGVGKSAGVLKDATTLDLATDAEAAVRFLRGRSDVDTKRIGVIGHSEGGLIAPLMASRDPALAFLVVLAGPGIRGDRLLVEQIALVAKASGAPDKVITRDRALHQSLYSAMVAEKTLEGARNKATEILGEAERKGDLPPGMGQSMVDRFGNAWFHALLSYEPGPVLQAVRQPVLVLNGELDLQVPPASGLPAIRTALQGNPRAVIREMPALNHLFQTAKTGSIAEYGEITETMAPAALETISSWIGATVK